MLPTSWPDSSTSLPLIRRSSSHTSRMLPTSRPDSSAAADPQITHQRHVAVGARPTAPAMLLSEIMPNSSAMLLSETTPNSSTLLPSRTTPNSSDMLLPETTPNRQKIRVDR